MRQLRLHTSQALCSGVLARPAGLKLDGQIMGRGAVFISLRPYTLQLLSKLATLVFQRLLLFVKI